MKFLCPPRSRAAALLARVALLALFTETVARLSGIAPADMLLLRAVAAIVSATALMPWTVGGAPGVARSLVLWSLCTALVLVAGAVAAGVSPAARELWLVALGSAVLVWAAGALRAGLARYLGDRRAAARSALLALLLALTLPLWVSPLVSLAGASRALVNTVVALCPVSYLASLAGVDYLRGDWFYRHTPFGGLRYDYLDPAIPTAVLLCLPLLYFVVSSRRQAAARVTISCQSHRSRQHETVV